jgi:AsmA protein
MRRLIFMQETDQTTAPADSRRPRSILRRLVFVYYIVFALLMVAFLPPYISVNRYQRRIAESIGQSLGRPVHLDKVSLNLLPLPGFTIENLVVSEDPAFGSEPVIRADSVRARLRVWPLWRRRVEFSSISFTEPSVNLVHLANGKWNLESILLQASRIQTAPTAQRTAGPAPRFPYIEATGARVNLKIGQEKMPISLIDAEFALWLPNPQEWHLRIEARPARTDTNASDTGIFRLEGTLGRASTLTQVPINLDAEWRTAPLGEVSRVLLGRDAGIRGDMTLSAKVLGTVGSSALVTRLRLSSLRRADFVPQHPLAVDLQCRSTAANSFHSFPRIECSWLPGNPIAMLSATLSPGTSATQGLVLTASIPDVRNFDSASARVFADGLPAATALDWLRAASTRIPADLTVGGTITASLEDAAGLSRWNSHWDASLRAADLVLTSPQSGLAPLDLGDLSLESSTQNGPQAGPATRHNVRAVVAAAPAALELTPMPLALGGKEPAILEGRVDSSGYTLHLSGMVVLSRLIALGKAVPQFGDGLKEVLPTNRAAGPVRLDITCTRPWGAAQTWLDNSTTIRSRPRAAVSPSESKLLPIR